MKSPIVAAVEGDKPEIVKMLLDQRYIPQDKKAFERSKNNHDIHGNNMLHSAFKKHDLELHRIISERAKECPQERNIRALLPEQMSHKKLKELEDEPDYMFVVKTKRAPFLVEQLKTLGLGIKQYRSKWLRFFSKPFCSCFEERRDSRRHIFP